MADQETIKIKFERNVKAMELRSSVGRGTAVTRARLKEGLTCEIEEGQWNLTADMGEKSGGNDRGPNPGVFGRAALASCLTIGYAMWMARRGVPHSSLEVEVQADYDARGDLGVGDVPPGYGEMRYVVNVESDAPEADVQRVLDEADTHSAYLAVFSQPQRLRREVRISAARSE